jgi:hypothetical protein
VETLRSASANTSGASKERDQEQKYVHSLVPFSSHSSAPLL